MPRAMWSGAISFGLVNIPVKLYKATASTSGKQISFHQIHKTCGTRLRHIRWCPKDEVEVPWDEVAKGYEIEKGKGWAHVLVYEEPVALRQVNQLIASTQRVLDRVDQIGRAHV